MERVKAWLLLGIVGGGGIAVMAMIFWIGLFIWHVKGGDELNLPLIIITGVVFLLVVLGLLTFVFSVMGLANRDEALGLPSGSVRAVIALMLLVVFAIVAIFLYSDVARSGRLQKIENVPEAKVEDLRKNVEVVLTIEEKAKPVDQKGSPADQKGAPADQAAAPAAKSYTVHYRVPASRTAEDLAKQLIVLLGTLVTAVSSFYFGSNSMAAAQNAMNKAQAALGGPVAKKASPPKFNPDGTAQLLTITGTNLAKIASVQLTQRGKEPILADASTIEAQDTEVTCDVTVPKNASGLWSVVVTDDGDNASTVRNAVTISGPEVASADATEHHEQESGEQADADKPTIASVDQTELKADGTPQPLKITGTNLGKADGVRLSLKDQDDVTASDVIVNADKTEVTCTLTMSAGTPGPREVAVFAGETKLATAPTPIAIT